MLSLHLLYKYKHSREEYKEEENGIYKYAIQRKLIMYTFEKEQEERNDFEVSLWNGINLFPLLVNSALKYFSNQMYDSRGC